MAAQLVVREPVSDAPDDIESPGAELTSGLTTALLVVTGLVTLITYWWPMLTRDLRFDENLTGWVISGSFVETVERSWTHQGQSPLYFMGLWVWQAIVGSSEIALRVPSLIALLASVWQLGALGRDIDHRRVGQLCGVFLLVVEVGATDARPYVFMILALIVSARFGLRWIRTEARFDGVLWVLAAAVAVAMQPFAVFALVPHVFIVGRAVRLGRSRSLTAYVLLGAALVAPIVPQVLMLRARQETLVITDDPTVMDLLVALAPAQLLTGFVVAALLDRRPTGLPAPRSGVVLFIGAWAVTPALGLFVQSLATGSSVFVERYYSAALPAGCVLVAMFLARLRPPVALIGAVAVVVVGTMVVDPVGSRDWYAAVDALEEVSEEAIVWTVTGYVESDNPEAFADAEDNEYLNAPLRWHGTRRELLAIPRTDVPANRRIIEDNVEALGRSVGTTVVLVESVEGPVRQQGPEYAETVLLRSGFSLVERQPEFGVMLTTFERV